MVKKQQKRKPKNEKIFHELEILAGIIILIVLGVLSILYFMSNISVDFCGDGKCIESEIGNCQIDCDWCGDGYCQLDESCSSCSEDCNSCNANSFCGDNVCNIGECAIGCWSDCSYSECENGICEEEKGENCKNSPNDCSCDGGRCNEDSGQCIHESCGNNVCDFDETYLNCPNDCEGIEYIEEDLSDINYPIIFVHGHSMTEGDSDYSINAFKEFQMKLDSDGYATSRGYILASDEQYEFIQGQWANLNKPISILTTYYLGEYSDLADAILTDDNYGITEYAERLSKIVDNVLYATGKNKVIIIAHSMGGLVSRSYIKDYGGDKKVDKLVTIGTPNHGTYGVAENLCDFRGGLKDSLECGDMKNNSTFIKNLNSGDETYGNVKYYTIAGNCDNLTNLNSLESFSYDEVILVDSVYLEGAISNEVINGERVSGLATFHSALIHPSEVPEAYNYVIDFLDY